VTPPDVVVLPGMTMYPNSNRPGTLALNAIRLLFPEEPVPAVVLPFDLDRFHLFRDRQTQDVFVTRFGEDKMVVVPLTATADLPGVPIDLPMSTNPRVFAALAREALFRRLKAMPDGYRVVERRTPTVETVRHQNVVPVGLGLPAWLGKRGVLRFETRTLQHPDSSRTVVLTCANRLRTIIGANCRELRRIDISPIGLYVSLQRKHPDPLVADRLRLAGRVVAIEDDNLILADYGDGCDKVPDFDAYLEPTSTNFNIVVQALTQDRAERTLESIHQAGADLRSGELRLKSVQDVLGFFGRDSLQLARGVPLQFGEFIDQKYGDDFPRSEVFERPKFSFDPSGSRDNSWSQQELDRTGPYDRATFECKRPRIAVICEGRERGAVAEMVAHLLDGLPNVRSANGLVPHGTGLVGRFRLQKPYVEYFEVSNDTGAAYAVAARRAQTLAASRDFGWDLAVVQVRRYWKDRPAENSPYWSAKAIFLKREIPVQAITTETIDLGEFEYACALANASLAIYAKLGGTPWLLRARPSTDHELVFGLGSHTHKEGRRGPGERVVGITTVFSSQGTYLLDARTAAVPFDQYPGELQKTLIGALERVRHDEAWRVGDAVRLVFHAFTALRQETAQAVVAAVKDMGLTGVSFAFLHIAEEHPFTVFDRNARVGKGAFGPDRGQAVELSDHEWLLALTGRQQIKASYQGIPDPVLLRLHESSTFRDMRTLSRQVSDFGCHSWRTYGAARLPITVLYADEIAKQLGGLERTPDWDPDAMVGKIMRRPWFL
jgi:hypothetical protein